MTKFLAGYWLLGTDAQKSEDWRTSVGADFVATSLAEAVAICVREVGVARTVMKASHGPTPADAHTIANGSAPGTQTPQLAGVTG